MSRKWGACSLNGDLKMRAAHHRYVAISKYRPGVNASIKRIDGNDVSSLERLCVIAKQQLNVKVLGHYYAH